MSFLLAGTLHAQDFQFEFGGFGSGDGEFIGINGVDVGADGRIVVTDVANFRVQVFDNEGRFQFAFGSAGTGNGQFEDLSGVSVDAGGRIYTSEGVGIPDSTVHRIQVFDADGNFLFTFGSLGTGDGQFRGPSPEIAPNGNIVVADGLNDRIQVFDSSGNFQFKFGSSGAGNGQFMTVSDVAVDAQGRIYASDSLNDRVQVFDSGGNYLFQFGSTGGGDGQFMRPSGIDVLGEIYVVDAFNDRVQIFESDGSHLLTFGTTGGGPGQFDGPFALAVDAIGRFYVGDLNHRIQVFAVDRDGDGLLDFWEGAGIDVNKDGTVDLDLPAMGADPDHKDLFVEVDSMVGRAPMDLSPVVAAFAAVPNSIVDNPDGADGIDLRLQLDETDIPLADWPSPWTGFDGVKMNRFGTPAERADANWDNIRAAKALAYRYCVFANTHSNGGSSGKSERPGNDFMVTLGAWNTPGGTQNQQTGTFMHEFGHALGLGHGGRFPASDASADGTNCKPNYHSVMNYLWQVPLNGYSGSWILDYSRSAFEDLDETMLDEGVGIGGHSGDVVPIGPPAGMVCFTLVQESGPVDWNNDGDTDDSLVARDLNNNGAINGCGPSPGEFLNAPADWGVLWYRLGGGASFTDGSHPPLDQDLELTLADFLALDAVNCDGTLCIFCPEDVVVDCNDGIDPSMTGTPATSGGTEPVLVVHADEVGRCVDGFRTVVRTWTALDAEGMETSCEQTLSVFDFTPPVVTCQVAVSELWPPNHQLIDVGLSIEVDECDPAPPTIEVTVTSDEHPADARGSGGPTHCPDAVVTPDGSVLLRAERSGSGDGRVYRVTVTVTDGCGNVGSCDVEVSVPKSKGGSGQAVDSGQLYDPTTCD